MAGFLQIPGDGPAYRAETDKPYRFHSVPRLTLLENCRSLRKVYYWRD
jgi:hypothetical protein